MNEAARKRLNEDERAVILTDEMKQTFKDFARRHQRDVKLVKAEKRWKIHWKAMKELDGKSKNWFGLSIVLDRVKKQGSDSDYYVLAYYSREKETKPSFQKVKKYLKELDDNAFLFEQKNWIYVGDELFPDPHTMIFTRKSGANSELHGYFERWKKQLLSPPKQRTFLLEPEVKSRAKLIDLYLLFQSARLLNEWGDGFSFNFKKIGSTKKSPKKFQFTLTWKPVPSLENQLRVADAHSNNLAVSNIQAVHLSAFMAPVPNFSIKRYSDKYFVQMEDHLHVPCTVDKPNKRQKKQIQAQLTLLKNLLFKHIIQFTSEDVFVTSNSRGDLWLQVSPRIFTYGQPTNLLGGKNGWINTKLEWQKVADKFGLRQPLGQGIDLETQVDLEYSQFTNPTVEIKRTNKNNRDRLQSKRDKRITEGRQVFRKHHQVRNKQPSSFQKSSFKFPQSTLSAWTRWNKISQFRQQSFPQPRNRSRIQLPKSPKSTLPARTKPNRVRSSVPPPGGPISQHRLQFSLTGVTFYGATFVPHTT